MLPTAAHYTLNRILKLLSTATAALGAAAIKCQKLIWAQFSKWQTAAGGPGRNGSADGNPGEKTKKFSICGLK